MKKKTIKLKRKKSILTFSFKMKFSLAMILLAVSIIIFMAGYFVYDESRILRNGIISLAEREIEHLTNTTQDALSTNDDLPIIAALNNIKKIESIKYAHIVNNKGLVLQSSDPGQYGKTLKDEQILKALENSEKKILKLEYPDPKTNDLLIYDFSMPVFDKLTNKRRIATVRLGFSNKIIREKLAEMQEIILFLALAFIGIAIFIALFLAWFTTKPLKKLSEGVSIIGTGNLDYKIDVHSRDEIGRLADEFNIMTTQLKDAKDKEIENRIMQEQLELAKEIQEGLNPMEYYDHDGIQIKGFTRAAKGVGGDYFDYIKINGNRIGALISDVSGKGIPASLVMVMIRTAFVSAVHRGGAQVQCSKIVNTINNSLSADFAIDKFATLFFMIYNKATQKLAFSNAGHGPLFCYRAQKNACSLTKVDGMPIGIMTDTEYLQAEVPFHKGDIVVLYTDGITEMRNEEKEEYSLQRLHRIIIENHHLNADELVDTIVRDVDTFKGNADPHDDMTTLIMKRVR